MRSLLFVVTTAVCIAVPVAAPGADWKSGDVFVGTSTGQYNVYGNGVKLLETIDQGVAITCVREAVDCAFVRSGVLHTAAFRFGRLIRFLGPHPHARLRGHSVRFGHQIVVGPVQVRQRDVDQHPGHQQHLRRDARTRGRPQPATASGVPANGGGDGHAI